jgi:hypothetical protein
MPNTKHNEIQIKLITSVLGSCPLDDYGTPLIQINIKYHKVNGKVFKIINFVVKATVYKDGKLKVIRNGCDDTTFIRTPGLARLSPRSMSYVETASGNFFINGLVKFGGFTKNDEDNGVNTSELPTNTTMEPTGYLVSNKANGKYSGITIKVIEGVEYLFVASKNVHKVFALREEPVEPVDSSDLIAVIRRAFLNQFNSLTEEKQQELIEFLNTNDLTMTGELCDGKHMVPLPQEGVPIIEFFGLVKNVGPVGQTDSLSNNLPSDLKFLTQIGLTTIKHQFYTVEAFDALVESGELLKGKFTEGVIINALHNDTVLWMKKYKATWYVIVRMMRQILTGASKPHAEMVKKIRTTLQKRSDDFLNLSKTDFDEWLTTLNKFYIWFIMNKVTKNDIGIDSTSRGMGTVFQDFYNDIASVPAFDSTASICDLLRPYSNKGPTVIFPQGIQGAGKTFIASIMEKMMPGKCRAIEQDTFANGKEFMSAFKALLKEEGVEIIVVARCNSNYGHFKHLAQAAQNDVNATVIACPIEELMTTSPEAMRQRFLSICIESAQERTDHPTIKGKSAEEVEAIVRKFFDMFQEVTNQCHVIPVKWMSGDERRPAEELAKAILDVAQPAQQQAEQQAPAQAEQPAQQPAEQPARPFFLGLNVPEESSDERQVTKDELQRFIRSLLPGKKYRMPKSPHTTLYHSNQANPELLKVLQDLKEAETLIRVTIDSYYLNVDKNILVFSTKLTHPKTNESLDRLVSSGVPHITGGLPHRLKPAESKRILSEQQDALTRMERPLTYLAKVE